MKIIVAIFLLCSSLSLSANGGGIKPVRLMTYNIRNCIGIDGIKNIGRVADVIVRARPDVVALQEVDSCTGRSGGEDILAELARLTGMHHYFAPAIDFDGGKYGVGILCRVCPDSIRRYPLPGREEARTLIVADFEGVSVASTHLSLTEADRLASCRVLYALDSLSKQPIIVMGDFNDLPSSEFMMRLSDRFTTVGDDLSPTYPSDNPEERLDYIVAGRRLNPGFKVVSAEIIPTTASDHRPVVLEIRWD